MLCFLLLIAWGHSILIKSVLLQTLGGVDKWCLFRFCKNSLHTRGRVKHRGSQCDVIVPTRWRLSLLLLWLPRWRATAEMCNVLRFACNQVRNVRRMSSRTRLPTKWWPLGKKGWRPLFHWYSIKPNYHLIISIRTKKRRSNELVVYIFTFLQF